MSYATYLYWLILSIIIMLIWGQHKMLKVISNPGIRIGLQKTDVFVTYYILPQITIL
jgi:hypothetical protein